MQIFTHTHVHAYTHTQKKRTSEFKKKNVKLSNANIGGESAGGDTKMKNANMLEGKSPLEYVCICLKKKIVVEQKSKKYIHNIYINISVKTEIAIIAKRKKGSKYKCKYT